MVRFVGYRPEDGRWKVWGALGDIHKIAVAVNDKGERRLSVRKKYPVFAGLLYILPEFFSVKN